MINLSVVVIIQISIIDLVYREKYYMLEDMCLKNVQDKEQIWEIGEIKTKVTILLSFLLLTNLSKLSLLL